MLDQIAKRERNRFLALALLFQGTLFLVGAFASIVIEQPVWRNFRFDLWSTFLGLISTLPLLVILWFVYRSQVKSLIEIRRLLNDVIGRHLLACRWWDLCLLAMLAGISEECLFRGTIQVWLGQFDPLFGLVACSVIFGLCHAVTPTYAVLAALIGAYLGWMLWWTEKPNLLIPVICHSLYDLVAFVVVRNSSRTREPHFPPDDIKINSSDNPANPQNNPASQ